MTIMKEIKKRNICHTQNYEDIIVREYAFNG